MRSELPTIRHASTICVFLVAYVITVSATRNTHHREKENGENVPNASDKASKTGLVIRDRINAIAGVNRHSNYKIAEIIGKSERYVRDRKDGKSDWKLGDIELYGEATGYTISEITAKEFNIKPAVNER